MGAPMARCVVLAGHDVVGWDVVDAARAELDFCANDLAEAGRLGSLAAAEVISHVGPRPLRPFVELLD